MAINPWSPVKAETALGGGLGPHDAVEILIETGLKELNICLSESPVPKELAGIEIRHTLSEI